MKAVFWLIIVVLTRISFTLRGAASVGVLQDNLVLSTQLIM